MSRAFVIALAIVGVPLFARAEPKKTTPPEPREVVGPLVGAVTDTEANLWIWSKMPAPFRLRYWPGADPSRGTELEGIPNPSENNVIRVKLAGLKPATSYEYAFMKGSDENPLWRGSFITAPPVGAPAHFTMAVASCMRPDTAVQSSWYLLLSQRPAFQMLIGDNVYADTTDRDSLWQRHIVMRCVPELAAVLRHVPTFAIWDDHDYGPNDSDGTSPGKEGSLQAFKEVWANPSAGTETVPGAFFKFTWGDVDFFMLDGRYHRSPDKAPNDEHKRMLGDEQFAWLEAGLKASTAKFKVLSTGSTLKESWDDGWSVYDFERKKLFRMIGENRISGVLFLSGDIHRSIVRIHPQSETGSYDFYEVISSGIANSDTLSFATLEFNTKAVDPTIRIRVLHGDATVRFDKAVALSELTAGK